jgi:hypothetical protein
MVKIPGAEKNRLEEKGANKLWRPLKYYESGHELSITMSSKKSIERS